MDSFSFETGSFRDRNGRVFYINDKIYRCLLNDKACSDWKALSSTTFFSRSVADGKLVHTEQSDIDVRQVDSLCSQNCELILEHQMIPFISYPYEWSFSMLRDAALLQLELLLAALQEDMVIKDSSAFNVQWIGSNPVFIDVLSFEALKTGEPWVGYRQFCQLFLYPLFLQAYKNIPFQPWLRGSIDGLEPKQVNNLMSLRDMIRPGVFTNVYLQSKMEHLYGGTKRDVKTDLKKAGFNKALIQSNVSRMQKLVKRLEWKNGKSQWSDYVNTHSYTDSDHQQKIDFIKQVVRSRHRALAWDIGCNTGSFSRIVSENTDHVIAIDSDQLSVDKLYRSLKKENNRKILPLYINIADYSPDLGWRGLERKALTRRGKPELTLCLALIHHVVIGANIPLREFILWLRDLDTCLVIEFITKDDPMVMTLLKNKEDHYTDYDIEYFEQCLSESFNIERREVLNSGTRSLFYATPV